MDIETLLDNLGTIAGAPGGGQRLRESILDLALRGRLVPQDPDEEPAELALSEARQAKGATLAARIRGGESVSRVPNGDECAGELPAGWSWARIDDTGDYVNGLAFKHSDWRDSGVPIIRIQNLTNPSVAFNHAEGPFPPDRTAHRGDILVSWSATLGVFLWNGSDAVINQHIFKVIPDPRTVETKFLFHLLRHSIRAMAASDAAHGLVMKHINRGPFLSFVVRLPPIAEQERIVAKLDELARLCDALDACRDNLRLARIAFRRAALHALTEADDTALDEAWGRISSRWEAICGHPDSVGDIRRAILRLAVQGSLTAQDPADEPAAVAVARGQAAKAVVRARLRTQPPLPPTADPGLPLPDGWTWARVDDVFLVKGGIQKTPARRPVSTHYPYLRVANVQRGRLDLSEIERFELSDGELETLRLEPGDLLIVEGNGSESEIGRCARWDGAIQDCVHQNHPDPLPADAC